MPTYAALSNILSMIAVCCIDISVSCKQMHMIDHLNIEFGTKSLMPFGIDEAKHLWGKRETDPRLYFNLDYFCLWCAIIT